MAPDRVYVVTRDNQIQGIYALLEAANEAAREIFADAVQKPRQRRNRDRCLKLTSKEMKAEVTAWELHIDAQPARKAATSKRPASAGPSNDKSSITGTPKGVLSGKIFHVVGMTKGVTQAHIHDLVKEHGGTIVSAIRAGVDIVVLGRKVHSRKVELVERLGLESTDYDGLVKLIQDSITNEEEAAREMRTSSKKRPTDEQPSARRAKRQRQTPSPQKKTQAKAQKKVPTKTPAKKPTRSRRSGSPRCRLTGLTANTLYDATDMGSWDRALTAWYAANDAAYAKQKESEGK